MGELTSQVSVVTGVKSKNKVPCFMWAGLAGEGGVDIISRLKKCSC